MIKSTNLRDTASESNTLSGDCWIAVALEDQGVILTAEYIQLLFTFLYHFGASLNGQIYRLGFTLSNIGL